jgi:hypothetical protein
MTGKMKTLSCTFALSVPWHELTKQTPRWFMKLNSTPGLTYEGPDWRPKRAEWMGADKNSQKNSAYVPNPTPRVAHDQVGAHTNLSRDLRNKAWKARKQSGSKQESARATKRKVETYRVNRHKWLGHTEPSRATLGHTSISVRVNLPPSDHPITSDRIT